MTPSTPQFEAVLRRAAAANRTAQPVTPSSVVMETDNATLYRYATEDTAGGPPLLIVYSLVNRPAILDLSLGRSVIRRLLAGGLDVHLLAWRPPGQARRYLGLSDYVLGDLADASAWLDRRHGGPPHVLGVCQGGVLALCQAALADAGAGGFGPRPRSLTTLAAPVDTGSPGDQLAQLARSVDFEALTRATGNVAGQALAGIFASLKPFALGPRRYRALAGLAEADDAAVDAFMRMESWMYDGPDLAARAFAEFARGIYQDNALVRGTLALDGHPVDLARVTCPVFSAHALGDHLVPPSAAAGLGRHVGGPCEELALPGGHLGLFVSARAHQRLYPTLINWLRTIP